MKIVVPGGSGQLGQILAPALRAKGHEVTVLGRTPDPSRHIVGWDARTLGPWVDEIDGSDVVVNLAGKSVNCRYTPANLDEMLRSRIDSTRVLGEAIAAAKQPPRVWLQSSTATIYAHTFDAPHDEATGVIGGNEPDVPPYWSFSIRIATEWEQAMAEAATPRTRKVAMRMAMIMSPHRGGVFDILYGLARRGLGGAVAGGSQFMSWLHHVDLLRAIDHLVAHDDLEGPVNLAAPNPMPQREFMAVLRDAAGVRIGLPATAWMLEVAAFFLRTDSELMLKSRRVVPGRLLASGFRFEFPEWPPAAHDLVASWKREQAGTAA